MKKKIIYILLAIIFIASIIVTAVKGLTVGLNYGEGMTIKFNENVEININEIRDLAKGIWTNQEVLVQKVEFFNDSAIIKVKEASQEQLQTLCDKLNEKYSSELKVENLTVENVSNVKIRTLVEPYIIPVGLSTLLIIAYYAVRFRGVKQMLGLIKNLVIFEGILYTAYALIRIPITGITLPLFLIVYILVVLGYTVKSEKQ